MHHTHSHLPVLAPPPPHPPPKGKGNNAKHLQSPVHLLSAHPAQRTPHSYQPCWDPAWVSGPPIYSPSNHIPNPSPLPSPTPAHHSALSNVPLPPGRGGKPRTETTDSERTRQGVAGSSSGQAGEGASGPGKALLPRRRPAADGARLLKARLCPAHRETWQGHQPSDKRLTARKPEKKAEPGLFHVLHYECPFLSLRNDPYYFCRKSNEHCLPRHPKGTAHVASLSPSARAPPPRSQCRRRAAGGPRASGLGRSAALYCCAARAPHAPSPRPAGG